MGKSKLYTADRQEGDVWVLLDEKGKRHMCADLPEGVHEGAKLAFRGGVFELLPEEERRAREEIKGRLQRLFSRQGQRGDSEEE